MTRKDYELIARAVKLARPAARPADITDADMLSAHDLLDDVVLNLCELLAKDNPRFDVRRFQVACGYLMS